MPFATTEDVITGRKGSAGLIRLNRPKALNSLTLPMVRDIAAALSRFGDDPGIATVIVMGEGERGFCAGGDIRALHRSGLAGTDEAEAFWREEFRLNLEISRFPKPYVALMDGITMGGGVGLSSHGRHRIVTERTRLAMPETGIGYFPDVGATWLLPRAPGEIGTWMGLTGLDVGAPDAIHAGLADHMIPSSKLPALIDALARLAPSASAKDVDAVITGSSVPLGDSRLATGRKIIDAAFSKETVEEILAELDGNGDELSVETLGVIAARSPTSLKLTLRLLRAGRESPDLASCLEREFAACLQMLHTPDFYEGIRAAVIDKDRNPKWRPARLDDVDGVALDRFFMSDHPPLFQHDNEKETMS